MSNDVAVIIPTHARHAYLAESIHSALSQTLAPSRVVVVSDLEDDAARAVVEAIAEKSAVLVEYVERLEGQPGASASRNFGANLTSSRLLAFLDDDDLWSPEYLESAVRAFRNSPSAQLIATWMNEFDATASRPWHAVPRGLEERDVIAQNPGITGSSMLITRTAFAALGGFDPGLRVKNDTDFFARFLQAGYRYDIVASRLVHQRHHNLGQLTGLSEARARGTEAYIAKHRDRLTRRQYLALRQSVHRIRSRSASNYLLRLYHLGWVAVLYGPQGLLQKIVAGRRPAPYTVRGLDE